ncbi:MAG TPA: acylphosphatase [Ignavibacteria bacterium]|nr:acylphosphatase [Ignavibacteria bacterium]
MNQIQKSAVKIIVSGRVQGVGFRYYIAREAERLGIKGYVRNLWNGDVEIYAEGRWEFVEEMIKKAKLGPSHSKVDSCKVEWLDFANKYDNFDVF